MQQHRGFPTVILVLFFNFCFLITHFRRRQWLGTFQLLPLPPPAGLPPPPLHRRLPRQSRSTPGCRGPFSSRHPSCCSGAAARSPPPAPSLCSWFLWNECSRPSRRRPSRRNATVCSQHLPDFLTWSFSMRSRFSSRSSTLLLIWLNSRLMVCSSSTFTAVKAETADGVRESERQMDNGATLLSSQTAHSVP